MYTSHGHHIQGTVMDGQPPKSRARCGGPGMCNDCSREAARAFRDAEPAVRIEWTDEAGKTHGGIYGLVGSQAVIDDAQATVDEPHLWFVARDGRIFGMPSREVKSILAVPGG